MAIPGDQLPEPGENSPGGGGTPGSASSGAVGASIFDETIDKDAADSMLRLLLYLNVASTDDVQARCTIAIDGSVVQVGDVNMTFSEAQSAARTTLTIPAYLPGLAAGQHRIVVSILNREPNDALTIKAASSLEITELKNAAL